MNEYGDKIETFLAREGFWIVHGDQLGSLKRETFAKVMLEVGRDLHFLGMTNSNIVFLSEAMIRCFNAMGHAHTSISTEMPSGITELTFNCDDGMCLVTLKPLPYISSQMGNVWQGQILIIVVVDDLSEFNGFSSNREEDCDDDDDWEGDGPWTHSGDWWRA
ncbi:hypothetical protein H6775_03930 [Candidatus Nomurabacteria bacterium]|nr:hypothetical protein [Candidatus Nomurabacteria bacterium]